MKNGFVILSIMVALSTSTFADTSESQLFNALDSAGSSDPAVVGHSISALRSAGPYGLRRLLARYDKSHDPKLIPVIDAVAAQHDAVYSRLFWYTDLDQANSAAREQNKPILYLRLLGKLTDEYSCANSRFFRTVLYANADVSNLLRNQFILVWQSERPVPVITIDYGDGRVLKRTVTGNSIHYVLDPQGHVVDALPGLYDPETFASILNGAITEAKQSGPHGTYLEQTDNALLQAWQADIMMVTPDIVAAISPVVNPTAPNAMGLALSKCAVEKPVLAQLDPQFAVALAKLADAADAATWEQVAALNPYLGRLDVSSVAMIRSQNPSAYADQNALDKTVAQFEKLIAQDTVRNNFVYRRQILEWLAASWGTMSLEDLNKRVYNELFLTPRSDQWLGLLPQNTYSALDNDGVCALSAGPENIAQR